MASLSQVIDQMAAAGLPPLTPLDLKLDGRIHRYGPRKKAWYVLHEYVARNGKRFVHGAFGIWQGAESNAQKVQSDLEGVEPDEVDRLRRSQETLQAQQAEKEAKRANFAANRALAQWNAARASGESPYLARKGVQPAKGLRFFADGTLLVPMVRYDVTEEQAQDPNYTGPRRLAGLQKIAPDGAKLFNRGMAKSGAACRLGAKPRDGDLILLGEGVATMLSVLAAVETRHAAFVCFDAGNLAPVARIVRALYPRSPLLFCADDDAYLEAQLNKRLRDDYGVAELHRADFSERVYASKRGPVSVRADLHEDARGTAALTAAIERDGVVRTLVLTNAGRTKAWEASAAVGNAWVCWPTFAQRELSRAPDAPRLTDWNDLHQAEGLDPVRAQLAEAIRAVQDALALARQISGGANEPPEKPPGKGGGGGGLDDEPDWTLHGRLLARFTLIYPSDTAYDRELGRLVKLDHMRHMFGRRPIALWLTSPRKRWVTSDQVVFDPSETADPKTTVNLYNGIKMQPDAKASCERLLKLLQYLCGEEEADHAPIYEWTLNWCAYALQHVGAKMQTAIVMYGKEGTGKNLFWSAVRTIYGEHGGVITQQQLNSQFNSWASAKLFAVANEVVTRQEMRHHVGLLKNLVTEPEIWINRKQIDERPEENHMNLVFLSNEFQPLQISPDDRRYMIIRTPGAKPRDYYRSVRDELRAGGAAALYHYLLELEIPAEFDEHAKPYATEAKRDLIDVGLSAAQLYWRDIYEQEIPLPYVPALATDVYRGFLAWCPRNGEKMPSRINRWLPEFMSLNGVRRRRLRVPDPDRPAELRLADAGITEQLSKRQVLLMGEPEAEEAAERRRINRGVVEFREALLAYVGEPARGNQAPAYQGSAF